MVDFDCDVWETINYNYYWLHLSGQLNHSVNVIQFASSSVAQEGVKLVNIAPKFGKKKSYANYNVKLFFWGVIMDIDLKVFEISVLSGTETVGFKKVFLKMKNWNWRIKFWNKLLTLGFVEINFTLSGHLKEGGEIKKTIICFLVRSWRVKKTGIFILIYILLFSLRLKRG